MATAEEARTTRPRAKRTLFWMDVTVDQWACMCVCMYACVQERVQAYECGKGTESCKNDPSSLQECDSEDTRVHITCSGFYWLIKGQRIKCFCAFLVVAFWACCLFVVVFVLLMTNTNDLLLGCSKQDHLTIPNAPVAECPPSPPRTAPPTMKVGASLT